MKKFIICMMLIMLAGCGQKFEDTVKFVTDECNKVGGIITLGIIDNPLIDSNYVGCIVPHKNNKVVENEGKDAYI